MGVDDELVVFPEPDKVTPLLEFGEAGLVEFGPLGSRLRRVGNNGTQQTFFQSTKDTPVILSPDKEMKYETVQRFIQELIASEIPLELQTRSDLGSEGEKLFLGFKGRPANEYDKDDLMGGEPISVFTFCVYAEGNGAMFPAGEYGLIGHRDVVLAKDSEGEFVYTDHKANDGDYFPSPQAGWKFNTESIEKFRGSKAIERWKPEGYDPYDLGLGALLQGAMIAWMINLPTIPRVKTGILLEDGLRVWKKYGYQSGGNYDKSKAVEEIVDNIFRHVR